MPTGRFQIAFDADTLDWSPAWTTIDTTPALVASYSIDRGRQVELDRTDAGTATVVIRDRDGVLDPTNATSPYFGQIEPLKQARLRRWNPMAAEWQTRFRGFIESIDYDFNPSQLVNELTVTLIDIFEIVS